MSIQWKIFFVYYSSSSFCTDQQHLDKTAFMFFFLVLSSIELSPLLVYKERISELIWKDTFCMFDHWNLFFLRKSLCFNHVFDTLCCKNFLHLYPYSFRDDKIKGSISSWINNQWHWHLAFFVLLPYS